MIKDQYHRVHNYLRISLTERCNLRCFYCMPEEGVPLRDKKEFMTSEEVIEFAKTFVDLGVNKIRITGGEPLIKKDIINILTQLAELPVELYLTTNGILIDKFINVFKRIGLKNINISLDSLEEAKFNKISKRQYFTRIMDNIQLAIDADLNIKINVVLMRNTNDNEIINFINWTKSLPLDVRFIEFMPFDGNSWQTDKVVTYAEIMDRVQSEYGFADIMPLTGKPNDTAKNFKIKGYVGTFGIISSVTNPFCDGCNRIRLTADGKIKNCLFSSGETDLLTVFRQGEDIIPLIYQTIGEKHRMRGGIEDFNDGNIQQFEANRNMTSIGG